MNWFSVRIVGDIAIVNIGDFIGLGSQTVEDLRRDVGERQVDLVVNSVGGSMQDGLELFDFLRGRTPEALITGNCWSTAVPVALAADCIKAIPDARLMVHSARNYCLGSAAELRQSADYIERLNGRLAALLCERTGNPPQVVAQWLDHDSWMSPDEAWQARLVHEILPPAPAAVAESGESPETPFTQDDGSEALALDLLRALGTITVKDRAAFMRNVSVAMTYQVRELPQPQMKAA